MEPVIQKPRVALFIDAENASPAHLPAYLEHCRTLGKPTIARCYGSAAALKRWESTITKYHLMPMQTPPGASKTNASDFALTIDAVSLLHRNLFDHAVIVSSDADFTLLALHIREHGKGIDGIGGVKATSSLRAAYDHFAEISPPTVPNPKGEPLVKTAKLAVIAQKAVANPPVKAAKPVAKPPAPPAIDAKWLKGIYDNVRKDSDAVDVQLLGRALAAARSEYKKGYRTLENFLRKSGIFEIRDKNVYPLKAARS